MKVTSVELHPDGSSDVAVLSFRDPRNQNPFNVKSIIGLDADEIVPRYYGSSGTQGFYNLAIAKRDVVIRIGLNPDFTEEETFSTLRDRLYRLIATSRTGQLQIQFKNGTDVTAALSGLITKFEASHFEKSPEVQITVKCPDPVLRALTPVNVDVASLDPANTVIEDLLSTAPHGFQFDMTLINPVTSFKMEDPDDASWAFEIVFSFATLAGDVLHFSSDYNNKYIYLTRGATTIYLADMITPGSLWPILFPGETEFKVNNPASWDWTSILHYPSYWGV